MRVWLAESNALCEHQKAKVTKAKWIVKGSNAGSKASREVGQIATYKGRCGLTVGIFGQMFYDHRIWNTGFCYHSRLSNGERAGPCGKLFLHWEPHLVQHHECLGVRTFSGFLRASCQNILIDVPYAEEMKGIGKGFLNGVDQRKFPISTEDLADAAKK
ncbi:hypothetical protein CROQUDRAFT_130789 [Cronartium quercuum f. sp. fusiforme G11]|uniref:Uncharacterized protein n=1 Tax=Cronartium quercuum f. sp. fusiforme G11 TaxID=708437 RepID=A0A9P6NQ88_9BASI|nr:hypothetical protein CROQUDRAFT_130789 [Cronartium quercuum f. sp. fusiforme G11]